MHAISIVAFLTSALVTTLAYADTKDLCINQAMVAGKAIGFKDPQAVYLTPDGTVYYSYDKFAKAQAVKAFKESEKKTYAAQDLENILSELIVKQKQLISALKNETKQSPVLIKLTEDLQNLKSQFNDDKFLLLRKKANILNDSCIAFKDISCEEYKKTSAEITKYISLEKQIEEKTNQINVNKNSEGAGLQLSPATQKIADEVKALNAKKDSLAPREINYWEGGRSASEMAAMYPQLLVFDKSKTDAQKVIDFKNEAKKKVYKDLEFLSLKLKQAYDVQATAGSDAALASVIKKYEEEIKATIQKSGKISADKPEYISVQVFDKPEVYSEAINDKHRMSINFDGKTCELKKQKWFHKEYCKENADYYCGADEKINDYVAKHKDNQPSNSSSNSDVKRKN